LLVINFNTTRQTLRCLDSIAQGLALPATVLVLDNGSTPDDLARLLDGVKAMAPSGFGLRVYRSDNNLGFAQGCNLLIELLLADEACQQVLLLNNDAVALPRLVERLSDLAEHTPPEVAMLGARMHRLHAPGQVDTLGIALYRSLMPADRRSPDELLLGPSGGCCLLKRGLLETLHRVSGYCFDARYFCYCEDTDLVMRAVLLGYRGAYLDELLALHEGQASSGSKVNPFIAYHGLRNSLWMHVKLLPAGLFLRHGLLLLLAHLLTIGRHTLLGRWGLLWRIYRDALARLPEFWRERQAFQAKGRPVGTRLAPYINPTFYRARYLSHVWTMERSERASRRGPSPK
jgi:GT2 family glycosyltransferase